MERHGLTRLVAHIGKYSRVLLRNGNGHGAGDADGAVLPLAANPGGNARGIEDFVGQLSVDLSGRNRDDRSPVAVDVHLHSGELIGELLGVGLRGGGDFAEILSEDGDDRTGGKLLRRLGSGIAAGLR